MTCCSTSARSCTASPGAPATSCAPRTPTRWRRSLEIGDRFDLARALSGAARAIAFAAEVGLRSARSALPRRGLAALRRPPVRRPLAAGVVEHLGEVALARDAAAARDPALVLRVAATAARTGLPVAAGHAAPPRRHGPGAARALAAGGAGRAAVAAGRRARARRRRRVARPHRPVGAAVPRVGRGARPAAARPRAHLDRRPAPGRGCGLRRAADHPGGAVRTCCWSGPAARHRQGPRRRPLGGGRVGDPADRAPAGVRRARRRAARGDGRPPPAAAAHRDAPRPRRPGDDHPRRRHPRRHRRGPQGRRRTGPAAGPARGPGRGGLAGHRPGRVEPVEAVAARRAGAALPGRAGRGAARPRPLRARRRRTLVAAVAAGGRLQVRFSGRDPATVLVVVADRPGRALGRRGGARPALAGGARGRAGDRCAGDGAGRPVVVLRFTVSPRFGGLPDAALLRAELGRVLDGTLALGEALARKERDYAPVLPPGEVAAPARVLWFDDEATGGVVLELRATDRIGMLHRVAAALEAVRRAGPVGPRGDAGRVGRRLLRPGRGRPGRTGAGRRQGGAGRSSRRCSRRPADPGHACRCRNEPPVPGVDRT